MFGPWFALAVTSVGLVALVLVAASVREQPRPLLAVHGLHWIVVHGLWRPHGTPSLGGVLFRFAVLYLLSYPFIGLLGAIGAVPSWLPDAMSLGMVATCGTIAGAAVGGAPWWSSELVAGADGVRVTGRWPRTPVWLRWSAVGAVRVAGRDLIIEGPEHRIVLSMAWGPRAMLVEVASLLEATRQSAVPSEPRALQPPPPELGALVEVAKSVEPVERR